MSYIHTLNTYHPLFDTEYLGEPRLRFHGSMPGRIAIENWNSSYLTLVFKHGKVFLISAFCHMILLMSNVLKSSPVL